MATQEQRTRDATTAILTAATELFGRDGFVTTSVNAIAVHAGVSKSGLLHHFGSKEELFRQVFLRAEQALLELSVADIGDEPPRHQLEQGGRALLAALNDHGLRQITLIDGPAVLGWAEWRKVESEYAVGTIVALLVSAAERDELAVEPSEAVAAMLLAALHEGAFSVLDDPAALPLVEDMIDRMIASIFVMVD